MDIQTKVEEELERYDSPVIKSLMKAYLLGYISKDELVRLFNDL